MNLKLNKTYLIITIFLFITEVLIAIYLKRGFIRHTFGDFLVVILLYAFFKSFIPNNLQLVNILEIFNLQNNHFIKLILGSTFQISDLVAYSLGIITVIFIEYKIYKLWIE